MAQNGAESIPIGIPTSCLKTMLPIVKKHLFMRKDITLKRVCLVKYLLPGTLQISPIDRCFKKANTFSDFRFEDKINNI